MASDPALCLPWDPPAAAGPAPADAEAAEAALVERARREPQAFAELYRMHYSAVGRYLFRRTGDAHATEDLLSEVFLAALRGIGGFRSRGIPFRYWLLRIATNAANREAARRGPELRPLESAAGAAAAPDPILGNPHLDDRQRAVLSALRTLGAKHQSVPFVALPPRAEDRGDRAGPGLPPGHREIAARPRPRRPRHPNPNPQLLSHPMEDPIRDFLNPLQSLDWNRPNTNNLWRNGS